MATRAEELRQYLAQGSLIAARWEAQDAIVPVPTPVPVPVPVKKRLILAGWYGNTIPTPAFIKANWTFLASQPFDGYAVYLRDAQISLLTQEVLKPVGVPIETFRRVLAPMKGLAGSHFAVLQGRYIPNFFDLGAWTVVRENVRRLVVAIRENGLTGVMFDNEYYASSGVARSWGDFKPDAAGLMDGKSLALWQEAARARGRELMAAAAAQGLVVITLHGPSVSRQDAPPALFPTWQSANELCGPFFEGFVEGSNGMVKQVDGGELYHLRTAQQFQAATDWRKKNWPLASQAFGVYDRPFGGQAMDPTILKTTLVNALAACDQYVWFYPELSSPLLPPSAALGMPLEWINAIRNAKL